MNTNLSTGANAKIISTWNPPGVRERQGTAHELKLLMDQLPQALSQHIQQLFDAEHLQWLNEIYLQLGQLPECIFARPDGSTTRQRILDRPCTSAEIDIFAHFFLKDGGSIGTSKRRGISGTIHRVSLITDPSSRPVEKVLGVTVRVGRAMEGLMDTMANGMTFLEPLVRYRHSLLLIGRPGVGKSTALREIACILSQDPQLVVVVVDKTKELAGDGETPHPAIGSSRWMPVGLRNKQHEIMLEAVENQSPDVVIVDEISTPEEVKAAQTIAQRGVMLIATVHGNTLPELIKDSERSRLVGGCVTVTLSGREADKRNDKRKQVLKRAREPVFSAALELHKRSQWIFHPKIPQAVDDYLENKANHEAVLLEPGKASQVTAIPEEGIFEYCVKCPLAGGQFLCSEHRSQQNKQQQAYQNTQVAGHNPFSYTVGQ